jgi:PPM family protein phosphatase
MVSNPPSAGVCRFIHFGMAYANYFLNDSNTGRPEQRSTDTVMEHTLMVCLRRYLGEKEKQKTMIQPTTSSTEGKSILTTDIKKKDTSLSRRLLAAPTIRLWPEHEEPTGLSRVSGPLILSSSGITDTGLMRGRNEDSYAMLLFENKSLFVVADGMGGHDSGEVASRTAVETVCRIVQEEHKQYDDPLLIIERAIRQANKEVRRQGEQMGSDMGTTLSLALVSDATAFIANVGDSRAYWMENGSIFQVTKDHSLVAKLVDAGKLTREEARIHPRANLLYRTIGIDEAVKVDTFQVELKKGGTFLLCTDGLWGELTDEDILQVCAEETDAKDVAAGLVRMANERGGKDNITAVVVKIC